MGVPGVYSDGNGASGAESEVVYEAEVPETTDLPKPKRSWMDRVFTPEPRKATVQAYGVLRLLAPSFPSVSIIASNGESTILNQIGFHAGGGIDGAIPGTRRMLLAGFSMGILTALGFGTIPTTGETQYAGTLLGTGQFGLTLNFSALAPLDRVGITLQVSNYFGYAGGAGFGFPGDNAGAHMGVNSFIVAFGRGGHAAELGVTSLFSTGQNVPNANFFTVGYRPISKPLSKKAPGEAEAPAS